MSNTPDGIDESELGPESTGESDPAAENTAEVEQTEWLEAERRESEARHAPDTPDRAFERITPQV